MNQRDQASKIVESLARQIPSLFYASRQLVDILNAEDDGSMSPVLRGVLRALASHLLSYANSLATSSRGADTRESAR